MPICRSTVPFCLVSFGSKNFCSLLQYKNAFFSYIHPLGIKSYILRKIRSSGRLLQYYAHRHPRVDNEQGHSVSSSFLVSLRAVDHKQLSHLFRPLKDLHLLLSQYKDDFQLYTEGMEAVCAFVSRIRKYGPRFGKDRGACFPSSYMLNRMYRNNNK